MGDVQTLLTSGVLDKTDDGKIQFPYDAVHVDFMLKAAPKGNAQKKRRPQAPFVFSHRKFQAKTA